MNHCGSACASRSRTDSITMSARLASNAWAGTPERWPAVSRSVSPGQEPWKSALLMPFAVIAGTRRPGQAEATDGHCIGCAPTLAGSARQLAGDRPVLPARRRAHARVDGRHLVAGRPPPAWSTQCPPSWIGGWPVPARAAGAADFGAPPQALKVTWHPVTRPGGRAAEAASSRQQGRRNQLREEQALAGLAQSPLPWRTSTMGSMVTVVGRPSSRGVRLAGVGTSVSRARSASMAA